MRGSRISNLKSQISDFRFCLCALLLATSLARAAAPIPDDKRIPATVAQTLAAPADQPMHMPTAVALDSKSRIFVADGANDRVVRFSAEGVFERSIAQVGQEKLNRPISLRIDATDRLWIADTGNHRILVTDADGKAAQAIDLPPTDAGKPTKPTDIALTPDGARAYVVDNDNHRLLVRDNASGKITVEGKLGRAVGQFQWPFMLCVGEKNYVYVTEAIGARVQGLSPQGRWSGQVGQWGMQLGQLYRPKGIAADAKGRLFVSDSTTAVVQVFDPEGECKGILTDPAGKPLRFEHPMGMCFDRAGKLYVVELSANRVAVVTLQPPPASTEAPRP